MAPLWEFGLGAGALRLPHYRGSDQSHNWLLPVPYLVYRGDFFKADRDGARAVLLEAPRFEMDISVAASAPTRSKDNRAREGMDDLSPTFEIGPNLNWHLAHGSNWKLDFRAPVRAVVTVDSSAGLIGYSAAPKINLDTRLHGWNLGTQVGALYGTRKLHEYFYGVSAENATPDRPAYSAPGGYEGYQATIALSRRFERYWVGMYARYDSLAGATFADSPLVRRRDNYSVGIAMAWIITSSGTLVPASD